MTGFHSGTVNTTAKGIGADGLEALLLSFFNDFTAKATFKSTFNAPNPGLILSASPY